MWEADLSGGARFVLGAEGKGLRPLVRRTCDDARLDPARREGRVAERQRRRGAAALRGAGASAVAEPTLYLFDGYNLLHAGAFEDPRELVDRLASFVALQRRARRRRLRRRRRGADARAARGALRRARRRAARAARRRAPRPRDGLPRLVRLGGARHLRAGGAEAHARGPSCGTSRSPGTRTPGTIAARRSRRRRDASRLEQLRRGARVRLSPTTDARSCKRVGTLLSSPSTSG